MIDFEEAYSVQEVAKMLQVSNHTVYEWAKTKTEYGGIPSYKIGGRVRIKKVT